MPSLRVFRGALDGALSDVKDKNPSDRRQLSAIGPFATAVQACLKKRKGISIVSQMRGGPPSSNQSEQTSSIAARASCSPMERPCAGYSHGNQY